MRFRFEKIALMLVCGISVAFSDPYIQGQQGNTDHTECRYTTKEPRGVITTPNFPNPYPVPISCQWIIEAPADKVIAVYFTQFYMREHLKATEYAYYSHNVKMGKTEFGTISSEREPTYLVSNKPVLVLDFNVREMANIHMRVREFLLDVFGFNITYEMIARNESVRKDACLYHHCSFTGNCYASATYDRYYCSCFAKYFGDECQYDLDCGPTASRNMCLNGGTCRYYIGSTVRTCECSPGFDGARCESRRVGKPQLLECQGPDCNKSVICPPEGGKAVSTAVCPKAAAEKYRYIISLLLTSPKANTVLSERKKLENFKREMEKALQLLFKPALKVMENITVIELRSDSILKFHMISMKEEGEELKSTLEGMLDLGKLGIFDFDKDYFEYEEQQALNIDGMEASEKMPVVEGQELTLACVIKGSESLHVQWFKDGVPVYVQNTQRGMWSTIVPKNSQHQYTALLGLDRASSLDTGTFTCMVTDWGFEQNRSLQVTVLSSPQPQLTPMAATVYRGEQLVITCLSKEDIYGTFGYTWLKNNQIINPATEPEMIEDLFPAGSRVLVRSAKSSAIYTCIITSSSGSTRKDSVVTVLSTDSDIPTCGPDDYMKVKWTLTASNTQDVQLCPPGYFGDVKRRCRLSSSRGAFWEEPDFSGCSTNSFLNIKKKVDSLRSGYLLTDVTALLQEVKAYMRKKRIRMQVCEGEPVVDLLDDIQRIDHASRDDPREGWQAFLDIASMLLESPRLIRKHAKIIKLHEQIFEYGFLYAESKYDIGFESFKRRYIAVDIGKVNYGVKQAIRFPMQRYSRATKHSDDQTDMTGWTSNSVEFDISEWISDKTEESNNTGSIAVVFYKNLNPYLPQRFVSKKGFVDVEHRLISSLVEVRIKAQSLKESGISIKVKLASFNYSIEDHVGWNISCAMADFSQGRILFVTSGCQLVWTNNNITLCDCEKLGTYALLLTHYNLPIEIPVKNGLEIIAGVGCSICAFFLLITFTLLLSVWRKVRRAITALKLQICAALIGAYVAFFCGIHDSLPVDLYPYTVTVIQFFLLSGFSLQMSLALLIYIECIDLRNMPYSSAKISAMGWTIPIIILGATLAAQSLDGFKLNGWWLTVGSTFFYAYISSILILTMFQVLLFLTVKSEIRNHGKVVDFIHKKKAKIHSNRLKTLHRSLVLSSILLLVSVASILYVNFNRIFFKYFFATTSSILGFTVFLSYTFCSERHFILCCWDETSSESHEHEVSSISSRNNSFKSFLKPELIDDTYASKMHQEAEKRSDRIKRMYSQIERASISKTLNPYHQSQQEISSSDIPQHQQAPPPDISAHTQHGRLASPTASMNDSPSKRRGDAFYNPDQDESGYPQMQWRYATHQPHGYNDGSPAVVQQHDLHLQHHRQPESIQRPVFFEDGSADHQLQQQWRNIETSAISDTDHQNLTSTFHASPQTVTADVTALRSSQLSVSRAICEGYSDCSADEQLLSDPLLEDRGGNLKNSYFAHHTDSLETVVYCEDPRGIGSRSSRESTGDPHTQSWNTTSV